MDRSPDIGAETREAVCPSHGPFVSRHVFRRIWSGCPACADEREAQRLEDEARKDSERKRQAHLRMIEDAAIPARFIGKGFDNFVADTEAKRHALTVVRDFAEQFDDNWKTGKGLILSGLPGTGKSHLAGAALQALLPRDVRYMTCLDLIRSVRETWRRDSDKTEAQVLRYLERLDLLVIDEVGVQYGTDGEQTVLFEVLDRRYREMQPTILLTNQDKAGFKSFVGERTFDRLTETCRWVPFDWQSYRPQARREAA